MLMSIYNSWVTSSANLGKLITMATPEGTILFAKLEALKDIRYGCFTFLRVLYTSIVVCYFILLIILLSMFQIENHPARQNKAENFPRGRVDRSRGQMLDGVQTGDGFTDARENGSCRGAKANSCRYQRCTLQLQPCLLSVRCLLNVSLFFYLI